MGLLHTGRVERQQGFEGVQLVALYDQVAVVLPLPRPLYRRRKVTSLWWRITASLPIQLRLGMSYLILAGFEQVADGQKQA